ncbi:MAG: S8 family serine peptidase [Ignavibacteriota bacterium]|jgi:subtilisin family serine protease|nr:S8 family serine peptidase [Ignavibacteriales bacterium]QKJ97426.1 MAG: S8 family serine peptidase [Ignavibacteriota bacterium]GIK60911.1 MAG: hypothetical protein BroJett017_18010 [Ignavibacteriota bacterium]GJQ42440.1 MAG: hypothetical protein JETCAE03_19380 [Ignavibacteriaceae bacterium]
MRFSLFFLIILLTSISHFTSAQSTYFIKYKSDVSLAEVEQKVQQDQFVPAGIQLRLQSETKSVDHLAKGIAKADEVIGRIIKITFTDDVDESQFLQLKNLDPTIEYVQKSVNYKIDFVPNDSLLSQQWALEKIQAFDAWDVTTGSDTVLLGIIDTGIDYYHPDLKNKIWQNPGETGNGKETNGIDDDNNGFVDDYRGWDFTDRVGFPFDSTGGDYLNWDNDPFDEYGHGTNISGIAGAETNNYTGIAGVAPNIKLVNLRAFDPGGYGEEDDVAAAILYAVQMKVKVLNMSFGDYSFSYVLRDVIRYAYSKNIVLVGSSGNSTPPSTDPHYPSGYSEVICVGNSTVYDFIATNSNYGSTLDLVAPGTLIMSTAKDNKYALVSGTSAATPHVAATAALILSLESFTNEEVKQIIKSTTDDIMEPGWDIESGAGRLNTHRALTTLAPSIIKFNHPYQDFAILDDSLKINATVLSPLFSYYSLYYGYGFNPTNWTSLINQGSNQFSDQDIYSLTLSNLPDSVYCLRLVVQLTNGRTLEERVNFYIQRTPPEVIIVGDGPIYYGDRSTIQAEIYTSQRSVVRMFYRKYGMGDFNFITLDGFNTNNQFVKQLHYGFIPKELAEPNTVYEVYYEAENLAGLKNTVLDTLNNLSYFVWVTSPLPEIVMPTEMSFTLPAGYVFSRPVSFLSENYNEIFFQQFYASRDAYFGLYVLDNDSFNKIDSIKNKIPRLFGDFNNNGKKDFVSILYPKVNIDEQEQPNTFNLTTAFNGSRIYYPIIIENLTGDEQYELITQSDDNRYYILWTIKSDLSVDSVQSFYKKFNDNLEGNFPFNNATTGNLITTDTDGDLRKEVWFMDADADLKGYEMDGSGYLAKIDSFITQGLRINQSNVFDVGDYDGDGTQDFAILYNTNSIAPNFLLLILTYKNNSFEIITSKVFMDQSAEFSGLFNEAYQSLGFIDVDNDGIDELVLNIFPYAYIMKKDITGDKFIYFEENINTFSVFKGDLNGNGTPEVLYNYIDGAKFYEFSLPNQPPIPNNVEGFSIDSSSIFLSWLGSVDQYYIYRGLSADNLELIDSTIATTQYVNFNLTQNTNYYYAIQSFDLSKPDPYSNLSRVIKVYSHKPGEVISAIVSSSKAVTVNFSEKMSNTIENLQAFKLNGNVFPNSISPASQYSYLLTFRDVIPVGINVLEVSGLRDLYGSSIEPSTISFNMDSVIVNPEFFISSFKIVDAYNIRVIFNLEVDEQSATDVNNYFFEPYNKASSVKVDATDKKIININLNGQKPVGSIGREYVLRVKDIFSSPSTGSLKINEGAGSYIVLSTFASDLSNVYVYPNPVHPESGESLTFANLPKYAHITIWTIDGNRIGEIEEADGNGGVTFELKDLNGNTLSSGIYVYRVVMLDESKNEQEEKLGKFAVIK